MVDGDEPMHDQLTTIGARGKRGGERTICVCSGELGGSVVNGSMGSLDNNCGALVRAAGCNASGGGGVRHLD